MTSLTKYAEMWKMTIEQEPGIQLYKLSGQRVFCGTCPSSEDYRLSKTYFKAHNIEGDGTKILLKTRFFTRDEAWGFYGREQDGYYFSPWYSVCFVCAGKYWPDSVCMVFDPLSDDHDFKYGRPVCNDCINRMRGFQ